MHQLLRRRLQPPNRQLPGAGHDGEIRGAHFVGGELLPGKVAVKMRPKGDGDAEQRRDEAHHRRPAGQAEAERHPEQSEEIDLEKNFRAWLQPATRLLLCVFFFTYQRT